MSKKIISVLMAAVFFLSSLSMPCPVSAGETTDAWLSDWDYEIKALSYDGPHIWLNQYTGASPDVTVYGKAYVDGTQYPVCINVTYVNDYSPYITGVNCSRNIVNLTFESVDGTRVRSSRTDRLDDFFRGMENLESVHFGGNFQGNVAQASNMFEGCVNLKSVDMENLDLGYASIYCDMFKDCRSLGSVTVNCPNGSNLIGMFSGCSSLTDVTMTGAVGKSMYLRGMFENCTLLKNVELSGMDFSKTTYFDEMFLNCSALETMDMSSFDFSSASSLDGMFSGCASLKSIDLSAATWGDDTVSATDMFYRCGALEEVTVSEAFRPSYVTDMFYVVNQSLLRIKGTPSDEFRENVFPTLKDSNRYIGTATVTALIELEGKELRDGMFSMAMQHGNGSSAEAFNYADNGNRVELGTVIYAPGENTFTVEERYIEDPGYLPVISIPIADSGFSCEDAVRSKTVNIVLNEDGTLSVGE